MSKLQKIIRAEAERQGLSGYRIAKLAGMPMRTVQAYLAGTTDLIGERIEKMMEVLGLEVRAVKRSRAMKGGE